MDSVIAVIKGNRFNEKDIDNMFTDYLNIGKETYEGNGKYASSLFTDFIKKYRNDGNDNSIIVIKKRNMKKHLNSAMLLYKLVEFNLYPEKFGYIKYPYILNKQSKNEKVAVFFCKKSTILGWNSLETFLEFWYFLKNYGGMLYEK